MALVEHVRTEFARQQSHIVLIGSEVTGVAGRFESDIRILSEYRDDLVELRPTCRLDRCFVEIEVDRRQLDRNLANDCLWRRRRLRWSALMSWIYALTFWKRG